MTKISTYAEVAFDESSMLLGSQKDNSNKTQNYSSESISNFSSKNLAFTNITSSPYAIVDGDRLVYVDDDSIGSAVAVNLPAVASSEDRVLRVMKIGASHNVTIQANGAELINGSNTLVLSTQYKCVTLHCDGAKWYVIQST